MRGCLAQSGRTYVVRSMRPQDLVQPGHPTAVRSGGFSVQARLEHHKWVVQAHSATPAVKGMPAQGRECVLDKRVGEHASHASRSMLTCRDPRFPTRGQPLHATPTRHTHSAASNAAAPGATASLDGPLATCFELLACSARRHSTCAAAGRRAASAVLRAAATAVAAACRPPGTRGWHHGRPPAAVATGPLPPAAARQPSSRGRDAALLRAAREAAARGDGRAQQRAAPSCCCLRAVHARRRWRLRAGAVTA